MKKSKKELIIESFQKMDSKMLDLLLDDNKTYQGATKQVFLEALNVAFSKLREHGDTLLIAHKGFCDSFECSNKNSKGYSFVGNNSMKHIDLIFEDSNNEVKDICHCGSFELNDKIVLRKDLIDIDISYDVTTDINPNVDSLIKYQQYDFTHEELMQYQNTIIDWSVYIPWLEKHAELYKSFDDPIMFFYTRFSHRELDNFYWLYQRIDALKKFLESNDLAMSAVIEFDAIEQNNEQHLLKWLIKYEKTGETLRGFLFEDIDYENPENNKYFEVNNLKINASDFHNIIKFKHLFDDPYANMLEKYTTFSQQEQLQHLNEKSERSDYVNSLTYHLNKRGVH